MSEHNEVPKDNAEFLEMADAILDAPSTGQIKKPIVNHGSSSTTASTLSGEQMRHAILISQLHDKKLYMEPSKWIFKFNEYHKVTYVYKSDSVLKDGQRIEMKTYMSFLRLSIKEMNLSRHFSGQCSEDMVTVWRSNQMSVFLENIKSKLSFCASKDDLIKTWVKAATGKEDRLDVAVMKHFVWQVRRKLFGLPVDHHMMPILYGKSGGGKSQAVINLLRPMDELTLSMDLSIFSDQFRTRLFSKAYVMFFDEMARSERADIDRLKNIITSPTVDFRGMHTENLESAPQNCTFIGCSNDLVYDKIYDPTSARRYWQLNCSDKLDWKTISSIDYLALWKSVDENADCPMSIFLKDIYAVQEKTIRSKDLIEDWAEAMLTPAKYEPKTSPSTEELYESFKKHCAFQKINSVPTLNKFGRRLPQIAANLKWNVISQKSNRGTLWPLQIGMSLRSRIDMQEIFDMDALVEVAKARASSEKK